MNLREEILREHSRAQSQMIADYVGNSKQRLAALISLFLHDEYRVVQRAAWIVSIVAEQHPGLIRPHLAAMVAKMVEENISPAVRRNVLRILREIEIPDDLHGIVMDACFRYAADPEETIAARAFSLHILGHLAVLYPEIAPELRAIIETGLEQDPTPAFRSSAKAALREMKKGKGGGSGA